MRKNLMTFLVFVLLGISHSYANEEEVVITSHTINDVRICIGVDGFWDRYKIHSYDGLKKGNNFFLGPRIEFEYRKPRATYFDLEGFYSLGQFPEKAKRYNQPTAHLKTQSKLLNVNLGYGYTFQPSYSPDFLLSIFLGPGIYHQIEGSWKNRQKYWQFGFKGTQACSSALNIGVDFRANYTYNHIWGIQFGLPFLIHLDQNQHWNIRFKPYILKLNINDNKTYIGSTLEAGYFF